jgi:hypothetical protein
MSGPTRRAAIVTAALGLTAPALAQTPSTTAASKLSPELQSLIDANINGFNTQDNKLFFSAFGDTAIIIDGIAPYRWLNPNAPANWIADVEKWRKDFGVTKEHLAYGMGFWNVEGSAAYVVISGTLAVTIKGQSVVRTGTLAYTFAKRDGVWKIEAQVWGRTS